MAGLPEFPEEAELVVCTVKNVKNFGAFVSLDEYGEKEGFIHIAEVATGWIKYIRDYVREGQKIVCRVLRVDPSKGHIDLSLKQVNEHQKREKIQQWKNEQKAYKLLELVAERSGKDLKEFEQEHVGDLIEKFGTLYGAFEEAVFDEKTMKEEGLTGDWVKTFVDVAKENIQPPFVDIDGFFEISCPLPDGIVHIREALTMAEKNKKVEVSIQYMGAPRYRLVVTAPDYKTAEEEMDGIVEKVIDHFISIGGEAKFSRKA
ncbi:MAG: translation initiation factor IF-2 subunit alpha [Thermoplasmata archaeon]|nr:translation initiation factor IF-2 subunit alpha [Candidatus Thermoplasmatota archaeon]MCK4949939.1 translation initiation factor IF-2 subunit alpha [Thermoplasmata archaeon]